MSRLDVVIAAFNAADTIESAVKSALQITESVVVVDDGSTDQTAERAEAAGAKVIRQANSGPASARRRGLEECRADFVVFLDADDNLVADGVERSLSMLENDTSLAVVAGAVVTIQPNGRRGVRPVHEGDLTPSRLVTVGYGPWPPAAQVVRRVDLEKSQRRGPTELRPRFAEDYELIIRLSRVGRVVQHDTISCEYSLFAGRSARSARRSLEDKEAVRVHYASVDQIPVKLMNRAAIRSSTAMWRSRALSAHDQRVQASLHLLRAGTWRVLSKLHPAATRAEVPPATRRPLVVVPWLEGGGGQYSLVSILGQVGSGGVDVVALFDGCRDYDAVTRVSGTFVRLDERRSALGAVRAAWRLRSELTSRPAVYSLMRASHVVLGMLPASALAGRRLAASFHQLPSADERDRTSRLETPFVRRFTSKCDLVTAPSELACCELVERKFATGKTIRHVPNVIVSDSEHATLRTGEAGALRLLIAGRLTEQKGIELIPGLLRDARTPLVVHIAGDGPLRAFADRLGSEVPANVQVETLGRTDGIRDELDWSDALFMPSVYELNPIVVWEAWARGRPVVARSLAVFEELSREGPVFLFRDGDELARIFEMLSDEHVRAEVFHEALSAFARRRTSTAIAELLGTEV